MKKIYLAGPLGNWREKIVEELRDLYEFYNPIVDSNQQAQVTFVHDDLKGVDLSDIVLAYQPDIIPC